MTKPELFNPLLIPEQRSQWRLRQLGRIGALAASAALLLPTVTEWGWNYVDRSGEVYSFPAVPHQTAESDRHFDEAAANDNKITVISHNAYNQWQPEVYEEINNLHNPDALLLQEFSSDKTKKLRFALPGQSAVFAMAERRRAVREGGFGNAIFTQSTISDVKAVEIDGTSFQENVSGWLEGLYTDGIINAKSVAGGWLEQEAFAGTFPKNTTDGWQEERVVITGLLDAYINGEELKMKIGTSHIAGRVSIHPAVHEKQFEQLLDVLEQERQEGVVFVFCGDFNGPEGEVVAALEERGFREAKTGPTHTNGIQRLDYCFYHPNGNKVWIISAEAEVLHGQGGGSDHEPVKVVLTFDKMSPVNLDVQQLKQLHP